MPRITSRFRALLAEKEIQEKRRISVREIVRETGVSISTVQGIANNTLREIPIDGLAKICAYFGVTTLAELMEYDPANNKRACDLASFAA